MRARVNSSAGFALLDALIGGVIVSLMATIVVSQLTEARNLSTIAARDQAAARIVGEELEAARALGARVACASPGSRSDDRTRGGLPYRVSVTTTETTGETIATGATRVAARSCEVRVEVSFAPGDFGPRLVKAATRLYL